jgi:hypothetical protein
MFDKKFFSDFFADWRSRNGIPTDRHLTTAEINRLSLDVQALLKPADFNADCQNPQIFWKTGKK